MKKGFLTFLSLLLSSQIAAATHDHKNCQHEHIAEQAPVQKFASLSLKLAEAVNTGFIKVVPGEIYGYKSYPKEKQRLMDSFMVVEQVLNSQEFKEKVINYIGSNGKRQYTSNNGLSNEEVYQFLMEGRELLNGDETLGEANFNIARYYKRWSKVIGYTSPGKHDWIYVNGKFYSGFSTAEMASNVTHEWIHLMGFYHDSARDHDSVPYAVGYIVEDLAKKYVKQGYLE